MHYPIQQMMLLSRAPMIKKIYNSQTWIEYYNSDGKYDMVIRNMDSFIYDTDVKLVTFHATKVAMYEEKSNS